MAIYDHIGKGYANHRIPDKRLEASIHAALGDAKSVINVGAGAGSYEPTDRELIALEPSQVMIDQRHEDAAPVVQASVENIPFQDQQFDAAMGVLTMHHWSDQTGGLMELKRVAKRIVLFTWDPAHSGFWLTQDYFPEVLETDRKKFPSMEELASVLGDIKIEIIPIPGDCTDGFGSAYWKRPEAYLIHSVRNAISTMKLMENTDRGLKRLNEDLQNGQWHKKYGHLLDQNELDVGYRLIIAEL